jgi:glutamyl-tRNA reductase
VTELANPEAKSNRKPKRDQTAESDQKSVADGERVEAIVARLRDREERVRRRKLETAFRRLESRGEMTDAERRIVADLAADLANSLVERWVAGLTEDGVASDDALALLDE